jgi:hypothetical protein
MKPRGRVQAKSVEEIATMLKARPNAVDLKDFSCTFVPFADVTLVVLHRPYLNTVVPHPEFDPGFPGSGERHSWAFVVLGRAH